jgi:hypothetical protein
VKKTVAAKAKSAAVKKPVKKVAAKKKVVAKAKPAAKKVVKKVVKKAKPAVGVEPVKMVGRRICDAFCPKCTSGLCKEVGDVYGNHAGNHICSSCYYQW